MNVAKEIDKNILEKAKAELDAQSVPAQNPMVGTETIGTSYAWEDEVNEVAETPDFDWRAYDTRTAALKAACEVANATLEDVSAKKILKTARTFESYLMGDKS